MSARDGRVPAWLAIVGIVVALAVSVPATVFAIHQFTDVPNDNPFHADIDALADSGVTTGCGGTKYCPKDFVTREQMAAFMNRLGALSASKTPVVNADKVDGYQANELGRIAWSRENDTVALPHQNELIGSAVYGEVAITAPVKGFIHVVGSATINADSCANRCAVIGSLFHVETSSRGQWTQATVPAAGDYASMGWTTVFPVVAGTHTFQILLSEMNLNTAVNGFWSEITAEFVPFEGSGFDVLPVGSASGPTVDPATKE